MYERWTPGPWRISGSLKYPYDVLGADNRGVVVDIDMNIPAEAAAANTRLIASAPAMASYIKRRAESGDSEAAVLWEAINADV